MSEHIKINNVVPRIQYVADGITKVYEFPFPIFKKENIIVYLDETIITKNYTVTVNKNQSNGNVTFTSAPATGVMVTLLRDLEIERTSDFQEGGALRANTLNDELDFQIACVQQVAENLNRALVLPPYASGNDLDLTLPTPKANKAIIWSEDATHLENSDIEINSLTTSMEQKVQEVTNQADTVAQLALQASQSASTATTQAQTATTLVSQMSNDINELRTLVNNALQNDGSNIDLESMLSSLGFSGTGSLNNGYYKLPDGLIIQWGTVVCYATWNVYNYPIAFPHAAVIIVGGGSSNVSFSGTSAQGITSVKLNNAASFSGRFGAGNHYGEVNYIAIGY